MYKIITIAGDEYTANIDLGDYSTLEDLLFAFEPPMFIKLKTEGTEIYQNLSCIDSIAKAVQEPNKITRLPDKILPII